MTKAGSAKYSKPIPAHLNVTVTNNTLFNKMKNPEQILNPQTTFINLKFSRQSGQMMS